MPDKVATALKQATKGLLYPSETDAPFKPFVWKDGASQLSAKKVVELTKHPPGSKVEQVALADFFKDLTTDQDWHGKAESATVEKFRQLQKTLEEQLSDPKVYRIGAVNVDIYLVGRTPSGDWAGVQTKAVET